MPTNRLRLDFSLQTAEERLNFLNKYLPTLTFVPNEHETETLSDYILWGKNSEGLNAQQEGIVTIKEWAPNTSVESLEGLLEVPGFQEARFQHINGTHYRAKRVIFNRQEVLQKADNQMCEVFKALFRKIDETELIINYYDIKTGKRKNSPRASLTSQFTEEEITSFKSRAAKLTPRKYLQLRHYLVELRTEQYTYRDFVQTSVLPHVEVHVETENPALRLDEDIEVRPFGLFDNSPLASKIFQWPVVPSTFTEPELKTISNRIWGATTSSNAFVLDFRDPEHLLALYKNYFDLVNESEEDPEQIYSSSAAVLRTLQFYESIARLSDLQRELLHMKINHKTNNEIREYINTKYNMAYNENYISTIFRQKILPTIGEAANLHRQTLESIFYPEDFKTCKDCGRLYLRAPEFFMRQKKSSDGFAPRCKDCQKKLRERRKIQCEQQIRIIKN